MRRLLYGLIYTTVIAAAVGFVPLFGGPGYECALAYGVALPAAAALTAFGTEPATSPVRGLLGGLGVGAAMFACALAISFLHLLHVPVCDPISSVEYMFLSAGVGTLLGGLWGSVLRELAPARVRARRWRKVLAALSLPLLGIVLSVLRFYRTPMIFAFDPFVGYFSGTLYDTVVEPGAALLWYRVGSACTILGALGVALSFERGARGLRWAAPSALERALAAAGGLALVASAALWWWGARFDIAHDRDSIAADLGGRLDGERCTVLFPRTLTREESALLLLDCEEELADVERVLGARGPERLTAYFFRDAGEKKRLMGAANTYIAKPWRDEVYLQLRGYPHPVLGHEIAHVVAGSFGRGPFRIAGAAWGLLPNPGLIEGIASAASPDDDVLTDLAWCRAMKDAGLLPRLSSLFSLSFLGQPAGRAYTVAGAFVEWLREREGVETIRAWYGGADLPTLTGRSWEALEQEFHAHLDTLSLSPSIEEYARAKFDKPSVFGRTCPHLVDRLRGEGEACLRDHDLDGAAQAFERALGVDARDARSRLGLAELQIARGDADRARADYTKIIEEDPSAQVRERAREARADLLALAGEYVLAEQDYAQIERESHNEDTARAAEVRRMASADPLLRAPVFTFLIGVAPYGQKSQLLAGALLGEGRRSSGRSAALASYLLGKNLQSQGAYAEALPWLRSAHQEQGELGPRVRRELQRQLAIAACVAQEPLLAAELERSLAERDPSDGRNAWIVRLLSRCRGARR